MSLLLVIAFSSCDFQCGLVSVGDVDDVVGENMCTWFDAADFGKEKATIVAVREGDETKNERVMVVVVAFWGRKKSFVSSLCFLSFFQSLWASGVFGSWCSVHSLLLSGDDCDLWCQVIVTRFKCLHVYLKEASSEFFSGGFTWFAV